MSPSATVSQQISSLARTLLKAIAVLSVLAILTTLLTRFTFVEYRGTAKTTLVAGQFMEELFATRMAGLKWRLAPDDKYVEEFDNSIESLLLAKNELKELAQGNDQLTRTIGDVSTKLATYETQFAEVINQRALYDVAQRRMTEAGQAARTALSEIMTSAYEDNDPAAAFYAGRAQENLMLARYYLERFRRTEADADADRSVLESSKAMQQLEVLMPELQNQRRRELASSAIQNTTTFIENKAILKQALADEMVARSAMDEIGPQLVASMGSIINTSTERQNTLGPRGQAIAFWAVVAIVVAASAILTFGWKFSNRLSARIAGDIEDSVASMSRIAEGDLDAEVKNAHLDNEIGRMAQALEVFKTNGKEAIAAAEREKAAEAERREAEQKLAAEEKTRADAQAARAAMLAELSASLSDVVAAATEGDFSKRMKTEFDDSDLTDLAGSVNLLVEGVGESIFATRQALERVAQGDLTQLMEGDFKGAFGDLQNNTNEMIEGLKSLIGEISGSTVNLAYSSNELRDTSDALSKQAEQNAASLEETSAALEELTASIKQVSENVSDANTNASRARETAESSGIVASDAADAMNKISDASKEIAKVVTVINDIAFQINLLALNAGVEAARAGEAGRGFSVVASEVRQLAQRAGEAATEIDDVIARSDHAVSEGIAKVTNAQDSLEKISESVVGVSSRIDQITNAINEQVSGIGEINTAVAQIDTNTQRQAASFEEVAAAGSLLSREADGLQASASRFRTGEEVAAPKRESVGQTEDTEVKPPVQFRPATAGNLAHNLDEWEEF